MDPRIQRELVLKLQSDFCRSFQRVPLPIVSLLAPHVIQDIRCIPLADPDEESIAKVLEGRSFQDSVSLMDAGVVNTYLQP